METVRHGWNPIPTNEAMSKLGSMGLVCRARRWRGLAASTSAGADKALPFGSLPAPANSELKIRLPTGSTDDIHQADASLYPATHNGRPSVGARASRPVTMTARDRDSVSPARVRGTRHTV